jgi:hypothetical protein
MELTGVHWLIIVATAGGLATLAVTRPWRFLRERRSCPQCRTLLPRWDRWGWIEVWTCSRCGCQVGR